MDRLTWADRCLRLLGRRYRTNLITVVVPYLPKPGEPPPQNPGVTLVVRLLGHDRTIGTGPDLEGAIKQAISQLDDDELLAADPSGLAGLTLPAHVAADLTPLCPCGSGLSVAMCKGPGIEL